VAKPKSSQKVSDTRKGSRTVKKASQWKVEQQKRRPNEQRLLNQAVVNYLKSQDFRDWRGNSSDDLQRIVAKMNCIANIEKAIYKEHYEIRNAADTKYWHIRCS